MGGVHAMFDIEHVKVFGFVQDVKVQHGLQYPVDRLISVNKVGPRLLVVSWIQHSSLLAEDTCEFLKDVQNDKVDLS